jgi:hypothetical protein
MCVFLIIFLIYIYINTLFFYLLFLNYGYFLIILYYLVFKEIILIDFYFLNFYINKIYF